MGKYFIRKKIKNLLLFSNILNERKWRVTLLSTQFSYLIGDMNVKKKIRSDNLKNFQNDLDLYRHWIDLTKIFVLIQKYMN